MKFKFNKKKYIDKNITIFSECSLYRYILNQKSISRRGYYLSSVEIKGRGNKNFDKLPGMEMYGWKKRTYIIVKERQKGGTKSSRIFLYEISSR